MQNDFEIRRLQQRIEQHRKSLQGMTFADYPDAFKELEALKVRLCVAINPSHFPDKYAALAEERKRRRRDARRAAA